MLARGGAPLGPGEPVHVHGERAAAIYGAGRNAPGAPPRRVVHAWPADLPEHLLQETVAPISDSMDEDGRFSFDFLVPNSVLAFRRTEQTVRVGPAGSVTDVGVVTFGAR